MWSYLRHGLSRGARAVFGVGFRRRASSAPHVFPAEVADSLHLAVVAAQYIGLVYCLDRYVFHACLVRRSAARSVPFPGRVFE